MLQRHYARAIVQGAYARTSAYTGAVRTEAIAGGATGHRLTSEPSRDVPRNPEGRLGISGNSVQSICTCRRYTLSHKYRVGTYKCMLFGLSIDREVRKLSFASSSLHAGHTRRRSPLRCRCRFRSRGFIALVEEPGIVVRSLLYARPSASSGGSDGSEGHGFHGSESLPDAFAGV